MMSSERLAIRLAVPDDVPEIHRLIDASVRGLSASHYSSAQIDSALRHVFGVDTQLIADETYFVAEAGNEIAAAGGWSRRATLYGGDQLKTGADPLLDPSIDAARIRAFFVHPSWTRRGLASLIFGACLDAAQRGGFTRFELAATLPGEPLYAALGFTIVERYVARMPDGEELPLARMTRPIERLT
jgi:GNAT superfamily N-acetyltransferase